MSGLVDSERTREIFAGLSAISKQLGEDHEIDGLLTALDGRFVHPAPGGDLLRTPDILPTGRNLHGFDPFHIPSAFAVEGWRDAGRTPARPPHDRRQSAAGDRRHCACGAPTT